MLLTGWNFSMDNYSTVWQAIVQIGMILIFLLLGNMLRNVIPFLRKCYIPSALIGGVLLLAFNSILKAIDNESLNNMLVDQSLMQTLTYHSLGIGFVAMTLKTNKTKSKFPFIKAVQNGAITGGTYMLQAIIGIAFTLIMYAVSNNSIFYDAGVILPLAFGQGPGNAMTWDINFTNMGLFDGNGSFGLSLASIGFIVASVIGVIYINHYRLKGQIKSRVASEEEHLEKYVEQGEIPDTESIDKFSIQFGFVALGYGFAFLVMFLLGSISDFTKNIAWGFNFIWGVIGATLIKQVLRLLNGKKFVSRQYINNYQMDRISGFAFDIMIVAGVASIEISDITKYIIPIVVLSLLGTIGTIIYVRLMSKRVYKELDHESFCVNFGTLTGTASNGMILLKEIDPNFETPMADIFTVSQLPAMIFVAPLLLLLNLSATSLTTCIITLGIFIILFIGYTIFLLVTTKDKSK